MIDLHSHVLPGLDDGARDLDEALEVVAAMVAEGVQLVVATPHVREDFPTTPSAMRVALDELRDAIEAGGLPIRVLPGGEISLEAVADSSPEDLALFGLGGNPRLLLIEFPSWDWPYLIERQIDGLQQQGIRVVLGHPERNEWVAADPARLAPAVAAGAVVQLTASSVDGRHGRRTAKTARALLDMDLAHVIASDAHQPGFRPPGLTGALEALGDPHLARWLVEDVPAALLTQAEIPPRPPRRRRSRPVGSRRR